MKNFILGLFVGAILMITTTSFAEDGLEKIEAYLRPNLPITLDGEKVTLESSPIMYDGSTYVKLRDAAALTDTSVNWNEATQTVEISSTGEVMEMPLGDQQSVDNKAERERKIEYNKKSIRLTNQIKRKTDEIKTWEEELNKFIQRKSEYYKEDEEEKYQATLNEKKDHINKLKSELAELEKEKADLEGQLIQ